MAKGEIITQDEKDKIKNLYRSVRCIRGVATIVKRDPKAVRNIVLTRKTNERFLTGNNSIIQ